MLSQLSYRPAVRCSNATQRLRDAFAFSVVGLGRVELPTSPLSGARSSQLSYRPFLNTGRRPAFKRRLKFLFRSSNCQRASPKGPVSQDRTVVRAGDGNLLPGPTPPARADGLTSNGRASEDERRHSLERR
jgi:hypothetical protein